MVTGSKLDKGDAMTPSVMTIDEIRMMAEAAIRVTPVAGIIRVAPDPLLRT
jgi:hypothetical protein